MTLSETLFVHMHIVPCSSSRGTWGGTARLLSTVGVTVMLKQPITFSQPFSLTPVPSSRARGVEEKVLRTSLWCLEHWRASLSLSRLSTPLIHGRRGTLRSSLLAPPPAWNPGCWNRLHCAHTATGTRQSHCLQNDQGACFTLEVYEVVVPGLFSFPIFPRWGTAISVHLLTMGF